MANDKAGQVTREAPNARQCSHCADYFDETTIPGAVHLASCKVYNGHKNYETWNVSLWLDNEEGSHKYWRRMARTCAERVKDGEGNRFLPTDTPAQVHKAKAALRRAGIASAPILVGEPGSGESYKSGDRLLSGLVDDAAQS